MDSIDLSNRVINDVTWLRHDSKLKALKVHFVGSSLSSITKLTGLKSLTLDLSGSQVQNLADLDKLTGLTSLTIDLYAGYILDTTGLDELTGLTSLTLNLSFWPAQSLDGLDKLTHLTSLTIDLSKSALRPASLPTLGSCGSQHRARCCS